MKRILITDKNPHVRKLISRELEKAGYLIFSLSSRDNIIMEMSLLNYPDAVIIDPDLISIKPFAIIEKIFKYAPATIVIIHGFDEWSDKFINLEDVCFIEKNGASVKDVKNFITSSLPL